MPTASLASQAGFFREARFSSLPTNLKKRAPLKTSEWEASFNLEMGTLQSDHAMAMRA